MMIPDEDDLFGHALARGSDPGTSHEAAAHMDATGATTKLEGEVYALLKAGGRYTVPEIAEALEKHMWSISPRMKPLEEKGLIRRDGKKPTVNSSGRIRALIAWIAA